MMHRATDTRHEYTTQSHYPDTGPTSPGFYPLNAERLARKQPVPMLHLWFDAAGARTRDLPTTRQTLYPVGHRAGILM